MKPPRWMKLRPTNVHGPECRGVEDRPHLHYAIGVKRWHPAFWWFVVRSIWEARHA